jgi:DNA primase|tara:strand:+ start:11882 stop:13621 length:1740 start_codon:yes stop_codon:yes gene_type:complete
MIPEQFIQELLNRVDVVDVVDKSVPLKKAGANYSACCPFHNEKSPSFTVSPTKQFYHCFGCGAHGTAISFLMEYNGLSFVESIHDLAKQVGMVVPQEEQTPAARESEAKNKTIKLSLQDVLQKAAQYYKAELKKSPHAIEYLKGRGLSGVIAAKFQVGYAPAGWQGLQAVFSDYDNEVLETAGLVVENEQGKRYDRFRDRIMFPIHNQKGEVIGFGGRVINAEDTPKYYNSPETPLFQKGHELYGLFIARRAIRDAGRVLVVEGYMDVVALAQYGIDYAVAALGTATTPVHITKLMRQTDEVVFSFDGDNAGRTAAWRAAMNALAALTDSLELKFMFLPTGHDPDSYVREFGKDQFEAEVKKAMPLSQYIVKHLSEGNALSSQEDRVRFLNKAEPILKDIKAPRLSLMMRKKIAELAQVSNEEMQGLLKLTRVGMAPKQVVKRQSKSPLSIKKLFILLALARPSLVEQADLSLLGGGSEEDAFLRSVLQACLENPTFNPSALLHVVKRLDEDLMEQIQRELHQLEENLDFALEIEGARTQLTGGMQQIRGTQLLNAIKEKPFSALTVEEKEMLKKLGVK